MFDRWFFFLFGEGWKRARARALSFVIVRPPECSVVPIFIIITKGDIIFRTCTYFQFRRVAYGNTPVPWAFELGALSTHSPRYKQLETPYAQDEQQTCSAHIVLGSMPVLCSCPLAPA